MIQKCRNLTIIAGSRDMLLSPSLFSLPHQHETSSAHEDTDTGSGGEARQSASGLVCVCTCLVQCFWALSTPRPIFCVRKLPETISLSQFANHFVFCRAPFPFVFYN